MLGGMLRAAIVLFLLGAVLGPVLDYLHVVTGAIRYMDPARFVPWWVPIVYISASLSIGLTHPMADKLLRRRTPAQLTGARVAAGFVGFCAIWFASGAIPLGSGAVALLLAPASLALWWWLDRTVQGLAMAAGTAAGGVAVEVVLTRAGLFAHTHPDVLGVAFWLPCIYVAASVGIGNLGRWLLAGHSPRSA